MYKHGHLGQGREGYIQKLGHALHRLRGIAAVVGAAGLLLALRDSTITINSTSDSNTSSTGSSESSVVTSPLSASSGEPSSGSSPE